MPSNETATPEAEAGRETDAPEQAAGQDAEPSAAAEGAEAELDEQEAMIAALTAERDEALERLMRAAADLQNLRKRADRDRRDAEAYGGLKLARDILAVYDNLDAALSQASPELQEREPGFFNGVSLTKKEFVNAFAKHKIEVITPEIGERFDPNRHQAMFNAPSAEVEPGAVMQVLQAGFMMGERLLRPAMVGVAAAPAADSASETDAA